jgi:4-amino-4-deoxy-L-arabinose transferase-like glycosyltransferase
MNTLELQLRRTTVENWPVAEALPVCPPVAVPRRPRWTLIGLLTLTALLYVGTAPIGDLYDELDTQYSGGAREMIATGQWLVPSNNYLPRLQKPPLVYWLTAPSLRLFGQTEFAARLPTALVMCLLVALVYATGQRLGGATRGLMAGLAVATSVGWFIFGKMVMPEPFLTCFITGAFYCILSGYLDENRRQRWYLGAWACAGLAAMSKGLHGLAYPMVAAAALAVLDPRTRTALRPLFSWQGALVFLAIWTPWHAAMAIQFPGFLHYHFVNEQIGHVAGTHYPQDDTPIGFNQFVLQHAIWFFRWTLFCPAALVTWFGGPKKPQGDPVPERLLLAWMGVVGVAMMISTRQDYYGMCGWPAFALWLSQLWTTPQPGRRGVRNMIRGAAIFFLVIGLVGMAAAALGPLWLGRGPAEVLPAASRDNVINTLKGFSTSSWHPLLPVMWAAFGTLTAGGLAAVWLAWRGRERAATLVMAGAMVVPLFGAARGMSAMAPYFSLADIARYLNQHADPEDKLICENETHAASSLFFYLDHRIYRPGHGVYWLGVPSQVEFMCREHHVGEDRFLAEDALAPLWRGDGRIFLIIEESRLPHWAAKLGVPADRLKPLATSGTRQLLSNR